MVATNKPNPAATAIAPTRLLIAALIGGAIGAVGNLILFFLGSALGFSFAVPQPPTNEILPIPFFVVIIASIMPAFGAALVLGVLQRFTANAKRIFLIVGVVFLVLSMLPVIGLPATVDAGTKVALAAMHVVSGAAILGALNRAR